MRCVKQLEMLKGEPSMSPNNTKQSVVCDTDEEALEGKKKSPFNTGTSTAVTPAKVSFMSK